MLEEALKNILAFSFLSFLKFGEIKILGSRIAMESLKTYVNDFFVTVFRVKIRMGFN